MTDAIEMSITGATGKLVNTDWRLRRNFRVGCAYKTERSTFQKLCVSIQFMTRYPQQLPLKSAENGLRILIADFELLANLVIEVL